MLDIANLDQTVMGNLWRLADIRELEFAAASTLLAIRSQGRSLVANKALDTESGDESEAGEDVEDDWVTSRPSSRMNATSRDVLTNKFLDRLAETFSREKSIPGGSKEGSKHIAAAVWIGPGNSSPLTIILAKNDGPDERDRNMASHLQVWFRAVAATGRCSPQRIDRVWIGVSGLVEYSRSRLCSHISQINGLSQRMEELATRSSIYGSVIICLQCLCRNATLESTAQQLSDIVNIAYILRYARKDLRADVEDQKALRTINMLGRLRAAYDCFTSVALTFEDMSTMEITTIDDIDQSAQIDANLHWKCVEKLRQEFQLPKTLLKNNAGSKYRGISRLHVHAEMQILVSLAKNLTWYERAHRYIGISRMPCFYCNLILRNYNELSVRGDRQRIFTARPSHGKVYHIWTLPHCQSVPELASIAMATAVTRAYRQILVHLRQHLVSQPAIAESSAGVTESASISAGVTVVKRQYLATQRSLNSSEVVGGDETQIVLGPKTKSVLVGVLPADGSKPRLIPIDFHALPEPFDRRIREVGHDLVPDFYAFWGACQFDRRFRNLDANSFAAHGLESDFRLYWNENNELPENENIKKLLDIKDVDAARRFWYGDVFVVRYSEHPQTFAYKVHNTPMTVLQHPSLAKKFQEMWENQILEGELEDDRHQEAILEKLETDKDILYQRMTPIERSVLSRLPPNTLEHLAMKGCDDGAIGDVSAEADPHDPSKVRITAMIRQTALKSMGWEEFSSSHL